MRSIIDEIPYYKRPTEAEPIPLHHHYSDGGFHPECARCRIERTGVKLLGACEDAVRTMEVYGTHNMSYSIERCKDAIKQAKGIKNDWDKKG